MNLQSSSTVLSLLCGIAVALLGTILVSLPAVSQVDTADPSLYIHHVEHAGITIRGMSEVKPETLAIAKDRLKMLLEHQPNVTANLASIGAELRVTAGLEGFKATGGLISYATQENILKLPNDSHADHRDITVHELAHMLHIIGFSDDLQQRINQRYEAALAEKLWPGCYALTNDREFFAELTMWYFGTRGDYGDIDPAPKEGPEWFKSYDPDSYALLEEIYSGKLPGGKFDWTGLSSEPIGDESIIKSHNSDERCYIAFRNETEQALSYHWLDFEGKRVSYGQIYPHSVAGMDTYATHPWVVLDDDEQVLGIFIPQDPHSLVVLDEP